MKKLMMAVALAAFCGAVRADGIASANTVGYSGTTINAGQWYLVGVQFADVASKAETADFNSLISTTCTPGEYGDGSDSTYDNAPMIQVLNADGLTYSFYYLISDADDGNGNYTATAWVDAGGFRLTDADLQTLSKGFWFKSHTSGTLNCAGQVSVLSTFTRSVPAGQFEIVANPYPIALNLNAPIAAGFTPGEYGDGSDPTYGNAPMIQVLNVDGLTYSFYYLIGDADDGNGNYTSTEWVDAGGFNITGTQVPVGAAFWIKSATVGTFTFSL